MALKRVPATEPGQVVYRGWSLGLAVGGFAVAMIGGMGLALLAASLGARGDLPAHSMGSGFVISCLCFLTARRGFDFDTNARTCRSWWGFLFPLRVKKASLDAFDKVTLVVPSNSAVTGAIYPVRLEGPGHARLDFERPPSYERARKVAEDLSRSLLLPLTDRVVALRPALDPAHLGESLRERLRREKRPLPAVADPPPGMRLAYEIEGQTVRFHLPRRGFTRQTLVVVSPILIIDLLVFVRIFARLPRLQRGRGGGPLVWEAVLLMFIAVPVMAVLVSALTSWTVEASPDRLRLLTRLGPFQRNEEISSSELKELEVARFPVGWGSMHGLFDRGLPIVAHSDKKTLSFANHLRAEEKGWMQSVLKQVLTA